ncbi:MAG: DUF3310 domain-containing protein [Roseburia sp.]|nr:DUF3310 domain-containing protein [Roseburia sp.]
MADKEMVNHPSHYCRPGRKECIDEMIDLYGIEATEQWCRMTAYKYHYRMGLKDDIAQEVGKAEWYERKADELHKWIFEESRQRKSNAIATLTLIISVIALITGLIFGNTVFRMAIIVGAAIGTLTRILRKRKHDSK